MALSTLLLVGVLPVSSLVFNIDLYPSLLALVRVWRRCWVLLMLPVTYVGFSSLISVLSQDLVYVVCGVVLIKTPYGYTELGRCRPKRHSSTRTRRDPSAILQATQGDSGGMSSMHLDLYRFRSSVILLIIISFLFRFGLNCMRGNEKKCVSLGGRKEQGKGSLK